MPKRSILEASLAVFLLAATTACKPFDRAEQAKDSRPLADDELSASRGRDFLLGMIDPDLGLAPEFPGAQVYWLYHDNDLAQYALQPTHPDVAATIRSAIRPYRQIRPDKLEVIYGEATSARPYWSYRLIDVEVRDDGKMVRSEIPGDHALTDGDRYADLLLYAAMIYADSDRHKAESCFKQAMAMWDGTGFHDAVVAVNHR